MHLLVPGAEVELALCHGKGKEGRQCEDDQPGQTMMRVKILMVIDLIMICAIIGDITLHYSILLFFCAPLRCKFKKTILKD